MDQTLHALGTLFLKALPTFILVLLLHFYLKRMFFGPLQQALKARDQATAGARKLADDTFARADRRAAEHEAGLRAARAGIHREQEDLRRQWRDQHAAAIGDTRHAAAALVKQAKEQIAAEAAAARETLAADSSALAARIARSILQRRTH